MYADGLIRARVDVDSPEFLRRLKALEPDAVEMVYELHSQAVLRYALRQTGDWNQAQDLASEAFVRLLETIERYEPRGVSLLAWLYRVVRNLAIDQRRRHGRRPQVSLDEVVEEQSVVPEFSAEALDLVEAMAALSDEHREVLHLRFQEQMSTDEVALILGRSSAAVRSLQHRALEALRRRLGADGA